MEISKNFCKSNLTYNMYSENLINRIIDSVVNDRIMIDFYCYGIDYKQLFNYRVNKSFGGSREREFFRKLYYKTFLHGGNMVIPIDSEDRVISVQEFLIYQEIAKLYKEIKKYCIKNDRLLKSAIERKDRDREFIYAKRIEHPIFQAILKDTSSKVKGGFTRLTYNENSPYQTFKGPLSKEEFLKFLGDSKDLEELYQIFKDIRQNKYKCFKCVCIKAPFIEVLGLNELKRIGEEEVLSTYQRAYVGKARLAMLIDMNATECLREIKLENGIIYEEVNHEKASELIRGYLNDKIDTYKVLSEFNGEDGEDKEYDSNGFIVSNKATSIFKLF